MSESNHWIMWGENASSCGITCPKCSTEIELNNPIQKNFFRFCPHCGAKNIDFLPTKEERDRKIRQTSEEIKEKN